MFAKETLKGMEYPYPRHELKYKVFIVQVELISQMFKNAEQSGVARGLLLTYSWTNKFN